MDGSNMNTWNQHIKEEGASGGNMDYQAYSEYDQEAGGYDYSGAGGGNLVDVGGSTAIKEDGCVLQLLPYCVFSMHFCLRVIYPLHDIYGNGSTTRVDSAMDTGRRAYLKRGGRPCKRPRSQGRSNIARDDKRRKRNDIPSPSRRHITKIIRRSRTLDTFISTYDDSIWSLVMGRKQLDVLRECCGRSKGIKGDNIKYITIAIASANINYLRIPPRAFQRPNTKSSSRIRSALMRPVSTCFRVEV